MRFAVAVSKLRRLVSRRLMFSCDVRQRTDGLKQHREATDGDPETDSHSHDCVWRSWIDGGTGHMLFDVFLRSTFRQCTHRECVKW